MKRITAALAALALLGLAACNQESESDRTKVGRGDSAVGKVNDQPAEIINMPNNFSNLAVKCDGHGHRLYSTTHHAGDHDVPAAIVVIDDPTCGS